MTGFIAIFDGRAELMTKAELEAGDKVELRGFGSFRCRERRPRQSRNPRTGDPVEVPARTVPFFRAGSILQAQLNPDLTPFSSLT